VRDVSLDVGEREVVAVVGESGSGKTTVGRVALGVLRPTGGRVLLDGHDVWAPGFSWTPALRSLVQVVHQDPFASLNPVRTIEQTLMAPLRLAASRGLVADPAAEARRLLESVGLTPPDLYLAKYPFQLSGGQKQRVSVARATIMRPRLIVADEPVSAVDASGRHAVLDLMRGLLERDGISFLYVTHDLATARYLVREGRIVVMYLGAVVERGLVADVLEHPAHPYVEALLAAIPDPDPRRAHERRALPLRSAEAGSLVDLPPGCPFQPRCLRAEARCEREPPALRPIGPHGHEAACHVLKAPGSEVV
jgi:peptide/nickel transport system ATP-binding protein